MGVGTSILLAYLGLFTYLAQSMSQHHFNQGILVSSKKIEKLLPFHTLVLERNVLIEEILSNAQDRRDIIKLHRADPNHIHEVIFSIKQNNLDKLESILNDISDPNSDNYGKHLKREEISSITDHQASSQFVIEALNKIGAQIIKKSYYGEYITVQASIKFWEDLFSTTFHVYNQPSGIGLFIRSSSYSLPSAFAPHVSSVHRTVQFPPYPRFKPELVEATSTTPMTTPQLLFQFYGISNSDRNGTMLNSQAVWESSNQSVSPADLRQFQQTYNLPIQPITEVIGGHVGNYACEGSNGPDNCGESSLDIQYIMAVSPGSKSVFWYDNSTDFLVNWAIQVSEMANPPLVFSISYGADESVLSKSYMDTFDTEAMKLGLMGVTIMASSGDDGAQSVLARTSSIFCGYMPSYPNSSPYVVAVGATQGPEAGLPEKVCQGDTGGVITSGGGFSMRYPQPAWQRSVVNAYLAQYSSKLYPGFNPNGRAYPDVSLLGHNYPVIIGGNQYLESGTSASTPAFAGMVSLVNAARILKGKSPLGWITPALYSTYNIYTNDITDGNNNCNVEGLVCCEQGFSATPGWDPTTGFGSVNFTAFKEYFLNIGNHAVSVSPTTASSPAPTNTPTQSPTFYGGWLQQIVYENPGCDQNSSQIINQIAQWPTEVCLNDYNSTGTHIIGTKKISCTLEFGGRAYIEYFSDLNCNTLQSRQTIEVGCAYEVNLNKGWPTYSTQVVCFANFNNPNYPVPGSSVSMQYSAFTAFNDIQCQAQLSYVSIYKDGTCFPQFSEDTPNSWYILQYPTATIYSDDKCTKYLQTIDLITQCYSLFPVVETESAPPNQATNEINYYYTSYAMESYVGVSSLGGLWTPVKQTSPSFASSSSSSSLSGGAIAGIVVACVFALGVVGVFFYFRSPTKLNPLIPPTEEKSPAFTSSPLSHPNATDVELSHKPLH